MKTLDRNAATAILADLAATLHQFADARGLKLDLGRATFSSDLLKQTIEFHVVDAGGADAVEKRAFDRLASAFGLAASDYRREFDHPKYGRLRVVGFRPNAPKFPIAVEVVGDSKKLFFPVSLRDRIIAAR